MKRILSKYFEKSKKPDVNNRKSPRKTITRFIVVILLSALFVSILGPFDDDVVVGAASFDGDYRVDDTGSNTTIQWIPTISRASNGDIYTAWYDNRGGNGSGVYFAKSTDAGKTFGKNVLVNDSATYTYTVYIHNKYMAVDNSGGTYDGNIYIVWEDLRNDAFWQTDYDIYFARSTDGGNSFGTNLNIIDDTKNEPQVRPAITVDQSGNVYTVWTDLRDSAGVNADLNVYFAKSTNGGASFSANKKVDDSGKSVAECPAIAVNETGVIYVAWHDTRNGNADIYVAKSSNGGTSFGSGVRVTDTSFSTSGKLSFPSIAAKGSNVYISWGDNQSGNWDIRMSYSTDGGTNWSTPVKVNDDSGSTEQFRPDIAVDDNNTIYIAWNDKRNGDFDIYYANSTTGGSSFGTNTRVDHDTGSATQRYASIVAEPTGGIYVAWEDWRDDNDGKYVSGGGTDSVNDPNIYLAFGGELNIVLKSVTGKPPTPENLKVSLVPTGSALDITWDRLNVQNLNNYTIYWSMDGSSYGKLAEIPANTTVLRYTHSDLTNGLTYYYKISVTDNNGNESNLSLAVANIPDIDTDLDDVGNENDWDDDGDLVSDFEDDFPLDVTRTKDTDSDGLDDDLDDSDDDNDGYPDLFESVLGTDPLSSGSKPSDFDNDYLPDAFDNDIDNDGVNNTEDMFDYNPYEVNDTDSDGIGDNLDNDDDGDNVNDDNDAFPMDSTEWQDTDSDGTGDNADTDDDNDNIPDAQDPFPKEKTEWVDTDSDGLGDNFDDDDDNDGVTDDNDAFPKDITEWEDTDLDSIGDNADTDDDNDNVEDSLDAFPKDPAETEDTDSDGLGDNFDTDDDGDGYPDTIEDLCGTDPKDSNSYPDDTDSDDIPDNIDDDDDNDGVTDDNDAFPFDSTEWLDTDSDGKGDNKDTDDDNDNVNDDSDTFPKDSSEWVDTDSDGLGDNFDTDDDGDGYPDSIEDLCGTDPKDSSSYPADTDSDDIPDNIDNDDDNDGVTDDNDAFPKNPTEWLDTDSDGKGDNKDTDDDNDEYDDAEDEFPKDPSEWKDTDFDGLGDNFDTDDDNDGVTDELDLFPEDPKEWQDTDSDGNGDNTDLDDDNDGVLDIDDAFPKDPTEWDDYDSDGLGNNFDTDDDNDDVSDVMDDFPYESSEWLDTDLDGTSDTSDSDDDNDNIKDSEDKFKTDPKEFSDNDADGIGDNIDSDDDNDGVLDVHDDYPLDSSKSKEPEGVNPLWVPVLAIIFFVVIVLVILLITFYVFHKHTKQINSELQKFSNAMALRGSTGGGPITNVPAEPQSPTPQTAAPQPQSFPHQAPPRQVEPPQLPPTSIPPQPSPPFESDEKK